MLQRRRRQNVTPHFVLEIRIAAGQEWVINLGEPPMTFECGPIHWQVQPRRPSDLSERERNRYAAIVASYGGMDRTQGGFRRYRVAEACARSIRSELGIETAIGLIRLGSQ
jgi:hypothetical protein